MLLSQLLRAPVGSRLVRTDFDDDTLTLGIATTNPNASCPACGHETWRVHSRYTRHLAEEPVFGHQVRLRMTVRRFLCSGSGCPRRIFVEPLDGFAAKHARTTTRLARTHLAIGSALGGEAGARLAEKTAVPTSPDTLLRRVKQAGAPIAREPRDSSASTTGPGARGSATAPSSSTSRPATSSISCRTATPRPSRRGSRPIPASSWSAATVRRPTPRPPPKAHPRPSRSPIDGTC